MSYDTERMNAVVNNQDKIPFDAIYSVIIDPTFRMADSLRTKDNAALAGKVHGLATVRPGALACMLVSLDANSDLIAATTTNAAFAVMGSDLTFDYFETPGIHQITTFGPGQADGFGVHYGGGRAVIDRYMTRNDADSANLTYAKFDKLYRSTLGMLTKDSATDATVLGIVLHVFDDGRLDVKFAL